MDFNFTLISFLSYSVILLTLQLQLKFLNSYLLQLLLNYIAILLKLASQNINMCTRRLHCVLDVRRQLFYDFNSGLAIIFQFVFRS